ncbi:hypothetical protein [uncultured virus]|uniref:Uncharacterized protein n=1 Tax=uncultured virus TaxID=340016 RepID=A0A218MK91_9VIRU|nr:hypothetical protein [uncultured virus]
MARLLETLFNGKPLAQQVEKIRKASLDKKKRQDIRNVLIRQVSDFFETQGPFKPAKDATGYTTRFANPEAAPDALLNLEKLKDFVDEKSFQTLSSQLQTDDTGDAFVEFKSKAGTINAGSSKKKTATTLTGVTFNINPENIANLGGKESFFTQQQDTEGKNLKQDIKDNLQITSPDFKKFFFSNAGKAYRDRVITQINQKVANFGVFNFVDAQKGKPPTFSIFPGVARALNINNPSNFEKFIEIDKRTDKPTLNSDGTVSFPVNFRLRPVAEKFLEKYAVDVTQKFFDKLGKDVGVRFVRFLDKKLKKNKDNVDYIREIITIARELSPELKDTPLDVKTSILKARMGSLQLSPKFKVPKADDIKTKPFQNLISRVQLQELARKVFTQKMPRGPRRGPPLSQDVLTFRSGRFARSFQVLQLNLKKRMIAYTYDPVYRVHESSNRDPRDLLGDSIRDVVLQIFGTQFNVVRK